MRRIEPTTTGRLRDLELTSAGRGKLIEVIRSNIRQLQRDNMDFDTRIQAIEKTLVRLSIPLKAATWAAAIFAASIIALIWSLILGRAQVVFP